VDAPLTDPALDRPRTSEGHSDAVPGTWNFRDIGGIPTAEGTVRPGVLYRSAALARLQPAGVLALEKLGVNDVVDLRGYREIEREGADLVPDGVRVTVAPFHPEEEETPAHEVQQDDGQPWTGAERLRAYYAAIPTLAPAQSSVAGLLRTLATGTGSVLVHCAAGKDRTGWAVATVLLAAGADRDAVLADYLLSNDATEALRDWMLDLYGDGALRADDQILGVDPTYLQAAWDAADVAFGSFDGYLDAIGVDDDVLQRLRARLVG
jgi:protein-tyrosine phosphatase